MTTTVYDRAPEIVRAAIIFAKKPVSGTVKTRLCPPLTPEEATGLYSCMLEDTLAMARSLTGLTPFILFQDDPGAAEYFAALAPGILALPQKGDDLGKRIENAFEEIFARGFNVAAIIGTDSPNLPIEYIYEAFSLLEYEHTEVVFGPAEDGGYYLLALKRVWKELFSELPWSSGELLAASVERAKDAHLGASFLPMWYDIDSASDLKRPELLDEKGPAVNTRELLISLLQPDNRPLSDS